jgi:23S rRNA (uridine2552-2'-O)-methyltransferase
MARRLATQLLMPGGDFVVKVFQGELFKSFLDDVRNDFQVVRTMKPRASRSESAEMYLVCLGFKGW